MTLARAWAWLALAIAPMPATAGEPGDYQAAVVARQAGQPAEAKRLLLRWLADHPDDIDARLQLAYADLALGNRGEARAGFEFVLQRAPDYADARAGLALLAARDADREPTSDRQFQIDGAISDLPTGLTDWTELSANLTIPLDPRRWVEARGTYYERFGLDDVELVGRIGVRAADNVWLRGHFGGTPAADFRPEVSLGGGIDVRLSQGNATVLTLDGNWERFPSQDVVTFNPGVVQYFADGNAWITLRGAGVVADGGSLQLGGLARGDYVPAEGWRLFSGVADGPDTDLGVVTRVTSLFGGLEAPLGRTFTLAGSVGRDWRSVGADRTEFRLGLKARF